MEISLHRKLSLGILDDTLRAFQKMGIPVWLFLGTALGFYRDFDFCQGDVDDIDLALEKKYFDRVGEIKNNLNLNSFDISILPDGKCPEISCKKKYSDGSYTKIDLFFIEDNCWRFYSQPPQTRKLSKNYLWPGSIFPQPIEEYLTENYGDWKTPIPRDKWLWYRDNMVSFQ